MKEQEAYEIDPQTVKQRGEDVEWSPPINADQRLEDARVEDARRRECAIGEISPWQGWPRPGAANPASDQRQTAY